MWLDCRGHITLFALSFALIFQHGEIQSYIIYIYIYIRICENGMQIFGNKNTKKDIKGKKRVGRNQS